MLDDTDETAGRLTTAKWKWTKKFLEQNKAFVQQREFKQNEKHFLGIDFFQSNFE